MDEKALTPWPSFARKNLRRTLFPDVCLNVLSTTPQTGANGSRRVRITHPFHPLNGKQFDLIEHRCIFGVSYLYFQDDCGRLREIPAVWTDFVKGDAWVELAAGRSPLHAESLLELADWVQHRARGAGQ
jgi:Family of unknown function (DUF5372)